MTDDKVVNLELERIARLPMLDARIEDLQALVEACANQLVYLGHSNFIATFPVGSMSANISVEVITPKGSK